MNNTQLQPQNERLQQVSTDNEAKIQIRQIKSQSSFTEVKDTCQLHDQTWQGERQICTNMPQVVSREDIISIPETLNDAAISIRQFHTLLTSERIGSQFLQQKNESQSYLLSKKSQKPETVFILTHTQQIFIDNKSNKTIQQQSNSILDLQVSQLNKKKNKLKITKSLQQNHIPNDSLSKKQQNFEKQPNAETTNQDKNEITENQTQIKQQPPKSQPLKIQNLFVSSLRSNTAIKPPQSSSEQKPKIWQMFKNKRQNKQPTISNIQATIVSKQLQITSPKAQNMFQTSTATNLANCENIKYHQTSQNVVQIKNSQQDSVKKAQNAVQISTNISSVKQAPIQEQKIQSKLLFEEQPKSDVISFHESKHHPLQKRVQQVQQVEKQLRLSKNPLQQVQIISERQNEQKQKNDDGQQKIEQQQIHQELEQSQSSASQRQQMLVDYTHNKKYQQQLQKINRQKIRQLQYKLKTQEEINRQLERSFSFPIKFITSAAVGASTAGIAWAAKKNKRISLLLGIATTLATFVFSY